MELLSSDHYQLQCVGHFVKSCLCVSKKANKKKAELALWLISMTLCLWLPWRQCSCSFLVGRLQKKTYRQTPPWTFVTFLLISLQNHLLPIRSVLEVRWDCHVLLILLLISSVRFQILPFFLLFTCLILMLYPSIYIIICIHIEVHIMLYKGASPVVLIHTEPPWTRTQSGPQYDKHGGLAKTLGWIKDNTHLCKCVLSMVESRRSVTM